MREIGTKEAQGKRVTWVGLAANMKGHLPPSWSSSAGREIYSRGNGSMVERVRIHVTRIFAFVLILTILFSTSMWEVSIPLMSSLLFLAGSFLVGIASLGRLWCSLYIGGYKTEQLIRLGPYSMCRNPLYFFSCLGAIGVGLVSETLTIPAFILFGFCLYYPFVILSEQKELLKIHGKDYETYLHTTPAFFPKPSLLMEPSEYTVKPLIFRKHIFGALWFVWLVGILELIEAAHELGIVPAVFGLY